MAHNNIFDTIFKINHSGGSGSCFYLKKHNIFVTNYHVVEGYRQVGIHDSDKNAYLAKVVMVNPIQDVALLVADEDFSSLPEIKLAEIDVNIGQKINVAGFPYGMPFTVTEGTVSAPKQLMGNNYFIQTDAAVNPGNSGGPMFNESKELVAITSSKIKDADNMGFGIPLEVLKNILSKLEELDQTQYNVQCSSCDDFITDEEEYCPSCGDKLPEKVFEKIGLTDLGNFCEDVIKTIGIDPILARQGYEFWKFHKGSSEIRMFVYNRSFLLCTSPVNLLPKKNLEPILNYLLSDNVAPYQLGLDDNKIFLSYCVYIGNIFTDYQEKIKQDIVNMAAKADELDNFLAEEFGCEFSQQTKQDAI